MPAHGGAWRRARLWRPLLEGDLLIYDRFRVSGLGTGEKNLPAPRAFFSRILKNSPHVLFVSTKVIFAKIILVGPKFL